MNILNTSKKFLKAGVCAIMLITAGQAQAQQVTVDASIDSLQLLIGEQAKVKLEISMDAKQKLQLPFLRDTLVKGVEILDIAKPDTQMLNDGKRMLIKQEYTITSFDSALYYLPPIRGDGKRRVLPVQSIGRKSIFHSGRYAASRTILRTEDRS